MFVSISHQCNPNRRRRRPVPTSRPKMVTTRAPVDTRKSCTINKKRVKEGYVGLQNCSIGFVENSMDRETKVDIEFCGIEGVHRASLRVNMEFRCEVKPKGDNCLVGSKRFRHHHLFWTNSRFYRICIDGETVTLQNWNRKAKNSLRMFATDYEWYHEIDNYDW